MFALVDLSQHCMNHWLSVRNPGFVSFAAATAAATTTAAPGKVQIRRFSLPLPRFCNFRPSYHFIYGHNLCATKPSRCYSTANPHNQHHHHHQSYQQQEQRKPSITANMNGNGPTTRSKRKDAPPPIPERPIKQTRHTNGRVSPSENTPDVEMGGYPGEDEDLEEDLVPLYEAQPGDSAEWQVMLQKVVRKVVSIRFCQTCSFDTDPACASEATGFVVDAEKGLVETLRLRSDIFSV